VHRLLSSASEHDQLRSSQDDVDWQLRSLQVALQKHSFNSAVTDSLDLSSSSRAESVQNKFELDELRTEFKHQRERSTLNWYSPSPVHAAESENSHVAAASVSGENISLVTSLCSAAVLSVSAAAVSIDRKTQDLVPAEHLSASTIQSSAMNQNYLTKSPMIGTSRLVESKAAMESRLQSTIKFDEENELLPASTRQAFQLISTKHSKQTLATWFARWQYRFKLSQAELYCTQSNSERLLRSTWLKFRSHYAFRRRELDILVSLKAIVVQQTSQRAKAMLISTVQARISTLNRCFSRWKSVFRAAVKTNVSTSHSFVNDSSIYDDEESMYDFFSSVEGVRIFFSSRICLFSFNQSTSNAHSISFVAASCVPPSYSRQTCGSALWSVRTCRSDVESISIFISSKHCV
jgi:hypothetical protein